MRILLQFPEGLKQKALEHAKKLEKEGHEVLISASPTFGACDLAIDEAKSIGAEKLVHFGHAEFHHVDFNVEYVNYGIDAPLGILLDSIEVLKPFMTIGVVVTIQQIHQLEEIKAFYEKHGKKVVIGRPYGFAKRNGQILGCDVGSAAAIDGCVDAHVYVGGGFFHPLGALLQTTKPLLMIDPFNKKLEFLDKYREAYRKRRNGRLAAASSANNFGILVSTKNGQYNINLAKLLKARLEKSGMSAAILVSNNIDFGSLDNMLEFDAFVNTACPRIPIDDVERTRKPLLSANEVMEIIKLREQKKDLSAST